MASSESSESSCIRRYLLRSVDDEHDVSRFLHFQNETPSHNRTEVATGNLLQRLNHGFWSTRLPLLRHNEEDSFCGCYMDKLKPLTCECGEHGKRIEWVWDEGFESNCINLVNKRKDVKFHQHYSSGTAVIRGGQPMSANQHYWEVKMISQVYGTDMMVGIGTKDADIRKLNDKFCSVLGIDNETWGLSYTGLFHHKGKSEDYAPRFGQGSIIGIHLDMWNGTLAFYKNRQPLGLASTGLKGKTLYAMASSTAARSGMRIIRSCSFPSSLQFLCCSKLRKIIPLDKNVLDVVSMPPGLRRFLDTNLGWLLGEMRLDENILKRSCSENFPCECKYTCRVHSDSFNIGTTEYIEEDDLCDQILKNPCASNSSDESYMLLGPTAVVFQDYNRFHKPPLELTYDEFDEDSLENDAKRRKYSYNYIVGLSDPDSE